MLKDVIPKDPNFLAMAIGLALLLGWAAGGRRHHARTAPYNRPVGNNPESDHEDVRGRHPFPRGCWRTWLHPRCRDADRPDKGNPVEG